MKAVLGATALGLVMIVAGAAPAGAQDISIHLQGDEGATFGPGPHGKGRGPHMRGRGAAHIIAWIMACTAVSERTGRLVMRRDRNGDAALSLEDTRRGDHGPQRMRDRDGDE